MIGLVKTSGEMLMSAKILCFICILCLSLSMSGCCYIVNQVFVTPTPVPSATQMPTVTPAPATPTPYAGTYTPTPVQSTYVESYHVSLAAQTGENGTIKITNMGGAGIKYLSYFTVTNNGAPVTPAGLTTGQGSIGFYNSSASVNRIVIVGVFIDNEHKVLMDTTLYI
jgi:hypothetical protein